MKKKPLQKETAAKPAAATNGMLLKLLIDTEKKRVVHVEAGKDFVDFLLRILSLPVAKIVSLLPGGDATSVGSIANLHRSVETSLSSHMLPKGKDAFLKYCLPYRDSLGTDSSDVDSSDADSSDADSSDASPVDEDGSDIDSSDDEDFSDSEDWSDTDSSEDEDCSDGGTKAAGGGLVKEVTYMVTDDLSVMPLSTMSTIDAMTKLNVKRLDAIEERVVHLTMAEAEEFLKVCVRSKRVFTDFFLKDTNTTDEGPPQKVKIKKEGPLRKVKIEKEDVTTPAVVKKERYHPYK